MAKVTAKGILLEALRVEMSQPNSDKAVSVLENAILLLDHWESDEIDRSYKSDEADEVSTRISAYVYVLLAQNIAARLHPDILLNYMGQVALNFSDVAMFLSKKKE